MKKIIFLWLLMGMVMNNYAQKVTILDAMTGEPLTGVALMSDKPRGITFTNNEGLADISKLAGALRIEIRMHGYRTEISSYESLKGELRIMKLVPVSFNLDIMVISATRWSQSSHDIPARIVTLNADEVAMKNPQTAADLLGLSGRVFIQKSQQGGGSPMIRGFSTNRLLYTVDGVRMNTAIFRSGNIQNVISLDPFTIENTEVFFGSGSVIYGSDAIGGVMSFQTLTPEFSTSDKPLVKGSALSRYSSANNETTAHFDVNAGWKHWAFITSLSSCNYGDLRMGSYGPDEYLRHFYVQRIDSFDVVVKNDDPRIQRPSGYSQMNIMQKIRYKPSEAWDIQYGFHYSETSPYARYDRHIRYRNGLPRSAEWDYGPQKWMMHNVSVLNSSSNKVYDQTTLRIAWQAFEESRIDRNFNKPERYTRIEEVDAVSVNLDFNKSLANRHSLFYGLEVVNNDVISTGVDTDIKTGLSVQGPSRYPQSVWGSYALYLTDQVKLSERFLFQAGLRYNHFILKADFDTTFYSFPFTSGEVNSGAVTGSAGIVYRPADKWVLSANISSGFRAPNVDDMGKIFDSAPGIVVVPNPDLDAEYAWNGDLEIAKIFGDFLKVDLSGYFTYLDNAMVRRDFTLNGADSIMYEGELSRVQAIQNAAVARVWGVQAGFELKLPAGFRLISDFNYQKGEEELDDGSVSPGRHAAPWYGITRLTWKGQGLRMEIYSLYSGKKSFAYLPEEEKGKTEIYAIDRNGNPWSPGWFTLNFKAYQQINRNFFVSAGLENITDRRYRPYSSGIAAPGRNFVISLKAVF